MRYEYQGFVLAMRELVYQRQTETLVLEIQTMERLVQNQQQGVLYYRPREQ